MRALRLGVRSEVDGGRELDLDLALGVSSGSFFGDGLVDVSDLGRTR